MRQAIADQRANGRTVTETITEPSGRITTKVTHQKGLTLRCCGRSPRTTIAVPGS